MAKNKNKKHKKVKEKAKGSPYYPDTQTMANMLVAEKALTMSTIERNFATQMQGWNNPTEKQVAWLKRIYMKYGVNAALEPDPVRKKQAIKRSNRDKPMWVYIIRTKEADVLKIGISVDPAKRLKEIQTGNPYKLYVSDKFQCDQRLMKAGRLEAMLHKAFKAKAMQGEWFSGITDAEIKTKMVDLLNRDIARCKRKAEKRGKSQPAHASRLEAVRDQVTGEKACTPDVRAEVEAASYAQRRGKQKLTDDEVEQQLDMQAMAVMSRFV